MKHKIALFVPSLSGGGAERVMVNLARGFTERGYPVDLVLAKAEGPYLKDVPENVRVVDLDSPRVLLSLPRLVRYLRRERPYALLSALDHANVVALWARQLANVPTKVVVSIHSTVSHSASQAKNTRSHLMPWLAAHFYPHAHSIIAVSKGVADDFSKATDIGRQQIQVIYNPIITPELLSKSNVTVDHPWFSEGGLPIVIGVGRLTRAKDFSTLIRAFARVRKRQAARLVILGEGEDRAKLENLVEELGVQDDVWMPGFVNNPYAFISKASVFALSSLWEGLPTVVVEAVALGTPVVATNCQSGPEEIFKQVGCGTLVSLQNPEELADAISHILTFNNISKTTPDTSSFTINASLDDYLEVIA